MRQFDEELVRQVAHLLRERAGPWEMDVRVILNHLHGLGLLADRALGATELGVPVTAKPAKMVARA